MNSLLIHEKYKNGEVASSNGGCGFYHANTSWYWIADGTIEILLLFNDQGLTDWMMMIDN